MSLDEEATETQRLMQNEGDNEEQRPSKPAISPVASNKLSSGGASFSSRTAIGHIVTSTGHSSTDASKVTYVNERRLHRDPTRTNTNKPKNIPKGTQDVKHMEKDLLELLDDFHTGKLSTFSAGCSMEQMINIRDQQENLAKLHFQLFADVEKPTDEGFDNACIQDKMSQLVNSLEQLSSSIEHLHPNDISQSSKRNP